MALVRPEEGQKQPTHPGAPAVRLFIPCYVDQLAPDVARALVRLLEALKISWQLPAGQTCCGQFAYNAGEWPGTRRLARHFARVFVGPGLILCPGPSCVRMVRRHYLHLLKTPADRELLAQLTVQIVDLAEYLDSLQPLPLSLQWPGRVFLHQSCAARDLGLLPSLHRLLAQIRGLEVATLPAAYSCCGFGGLFAVKQPELSQIIGWRYLQAILDLDVQVLVSPEVGCLLHLEGIARAHHLPLQMLHLTQFLAAAACL